MLRYAGDAACHRRAAQRNAPAAPACRLPSCRQAAAPLKTPKLA